MNWHFYSLGQSPLISLVLTYLVLRLPLLRRPLLVSLSPMRQLCLHGSWFVLFIFRLMNLFSQSTVESYVNVYVHRIQYKWGKSFLCNFYRMRVMIAYYIYIDCKQQEIFLKLHLGKCIFLSKNFILSLLFADYASKGNIQYNP